VPARAEGGHAPEIDRPCENGPYQPDGRAQASGWLLVSDWYSGGRLTDAALGFWREAAGVHADLVPLEGQAALLARAGFVDVAATDRSAWCREASLRDARRMRTTERARIEAALGEAGAGNLVERARMTAAMVGRDWLRAGHLRGRKPG
jgi:hypothetical protein